MLDLDLYGVKLFECAKIVYVAKKWAVCICMVWKMT